MKGERDYTQRVLATMRESGIMGGRVIFREDFESLNPHWSSILGDVDVTTELTRVWEGDRAAEFTMAAGAPASMTFMFPCPTTGILSLECLLKPNTLNVARVDISFDIDDGSKRWNPELWLVKSGNDLVLKVRTTDGAFTTLKTWTNADLISTWHLAYLRFNMATDKYEQAQFDNAKPAASTVPVDTATASNGTPYAYVTVTAYAKTTGSLLMWFDNILLAYEEVG